MRRFTSDEIHKIRILYENYSPIKYICEKLKAGEGAIKRTLQELGLTNRKFPPRTSPNMSLIGKKPHYSTVIGFEFDTSAKIWLVTCSCDCGRLFSEIPSKITNGQRKTCGIKECQWFHKVRQTNGRHGNFTGHEDIYGSRWKGWEIGARNRNIPFEISSSQGWELFLRQDRKCALTGIDLHFGTSWNRDCTASPDRKDSTKGYTLDNVQWVHKHINVMKRSLSDEEFIKWCQAVVLHSTSTSNQN